MEGGIDPKSREQMEQRDRPTMNRTGLRGKSELKRLKRGMFKKKGYGLPHCRELGCSPGHRGW